VSSFPVLLLLAGSASVLFAQGPTPAPADLLMVPEVSDRPVEPPGDSAGPDVSAVPETREPQAAAPEQTPDAPGVEAATGDIVPPPFPLSRYEELWKKSPFQLESTAPPVESAGLSQRYALTGIAEINGEPIAFVMERATQQRMMVRQAGGGGNGLSLVQVDVADGKYDESTVTLRQGAEVGVVKFDAGPAMPAPTMASPMPQGARPPQVPGMPVPSPSARIPGRLEPAAAVSGQTAPGVVPPVPGPGIPQTGQVQQAGQPQMPPPRVIRRRAIVPAAP
jgi:hypothetical protein